MDFDPETMQALVVVESYLTEKRVVSLYTSRRLMRKDGN